MALSRQTGIGRPFAAVLAALALYLVWTLATWLLEGRLLTLLRPDAVLDRLVYVAVANLAIGIVGSLLLVRLVIARGRTQGRPPGFVGARRMGPALVLALALGLGVYLLAGPATTDPIVMINAFAQVLAVSIAEVLVCWVVVAGALAAALEPRIGRRPAMILAGIAAAILFGVYHVAHSPPFDTVGMVAFLTLIGLATGLIFFAAGDLYATIVFHNFMGVLGVTQALAETDRLDTLASLQAPLLVTALVAAGLLIGLDRALVRSAVR